MIQRNVKILLTALLAMLLSASTTAQIANVKGLYVNFINSWLGNTVEEDKILDYCQVNGFNYITLYDLNLLNWSATQKTQLAAFITKAKNVYGVQQIGASGETSNFFRNYIVPYNTGRTNAIERFNVFNFEFEFWLTASIASYYGPVYLTPNGFTSDTAGAFAFARREYARIDSMATVYGILNEIYLGWPNTGQMQQLVTYSDRILLHAYRPTDVDVYPYTQSRIYDIVSAGRPVQIMPIFSAETSFMGPWLTNNPITKPYQTFSSGYGLESANVKQHANLQGYQWFLYSLMPKTSLVNASISTSGPTTFCSGSSVILTASTGATYLWSPGGQTTRSITVNAAGSYSVTVTGAAGNSATSAPVVVTVNAAPTAPTITANGPTSFCSGSSVILVASATSNYRWSNGATTQAISVSSTGSYSVSTTNNLCTATSTPVTVVASPVPAVPTISVIGSPSLCPGATVTLTSSASNGYLWSNGATTRSIVVSAAGTYSVRAYSGPSCYRASANITTTALTGPATPVISLQGSPQLSNSQPTVTLRSTSANGYAWSSGQTTRNITVNSQGSYRVTAIAANGCRATSAPVIVSANGCTPPAVPVITVSGSTVLIPGQTVTLTSSAAGGWLWSTGATTQSIVVSTAGTYTVRAYNAGSCFSTSNPVTVLLVSARFSADLSQPSTQSVPVLYPNPVKSTAHLEYTAVTEGSARIRVFDLTGRLQLDQEFPSEPGLNRVEINTDPLPAGSYVLLLSGEQERSVRMVVQD